MKNSILSIAIAALSLTACNNESSKADAGKVASMEVSESETRASSTSTPAPSPVNEVIANYLQLKNALANDDAREAASIGNTMADVLKNIDESAFTAEQQKVFKNVGDDAIEHAEHISTNAGDIGHQREHFDMLSQDVYDLVKVFGGGHTLYQVYCPMYNNNKGASWLSETKEIKNPYFGKAMLTCGEVKEELN